MAEPPNAEPPGAPPPPGDPRPEGRGPGTGAGERGAHRAEPPPPPTGPLDPLDPLEPLEGVEPLDPLAPSLDPPAAEEDGRGDDGEGARAEAPADPASPAEATSAEGPPGEGRPGDLPPVDLPRPHRPPTVPDHTVPDHAVPDHGGTTDGAAESELGEGEFELLPDRPPDGLVRRFLTTNRHFIGLLFGGLVAWVRDRPERDRHGLRFRLAQLIAFFTGPFVSRELRRLPFPVQLRRRLEILGTTYIKLGQVLSLREDILPAAITDELKNLLDRLPVVPFERWLDRVSQSLGRDAREVFAHIDPRPLGSASIAQIHRARTVDGDEVVLKVVKPGIRETLRRDAVLLKIVGFFLQLVAKRLQPRRVIGEFVEYTLREVDLRQEADHAETFSANFLDLPDVVFPKIYREYSSQSVLCMEFLAGLKPSDPRVQALPESDRDRLVSLGAQSIIRMLYKDGFFHADLHPGNLLVLPGPRLGFIDLGMVGRFNEELRRHLLYYFYSLVMGDVENAARYLVSVAEPTPGSDPAGFRREVEEICRRWRRAATFEDFPLAQLILESVGRGIQYRMYFPVEAVLMVKAIVTFEGVGQLLRPGFDAAAVSQEHIHQIFVSQFNPVRLVREGLRSAPDLMDALIKAPLLITEGLRLLEAQTRQSGKNPFAGIRGTIFGGFCLVAGAIVGAGGAPWYWAALLFGLGVLLAVRPAR